MDEFTKSYVETALWSTDEVFKLEDLAPETLTKMEDDCRRFQEENEADLTTFSHPRYSASEMGGHDFWLTRNGHGAGFWDGDWREGVEDRLTEAARRFGECNLYAGDDGKIYAL